MSGGDSASWNRNVFGAMILENPDSARFEMWFTGSDAPHSYPYRPGFATSPDGVDWNYIHPNPILEPDSGMWDETTVEFPMVLLENGQYKMWYTGWHQPHYLCIGYATSGDGINWQKYLGNLGNPVLEPGTEPWEAGGAGYCSII
jgi:hypothetical protein